MAKHTAAEEMREALEKLLRDADLLSSTSYQISRESYAKAYSALKAFDAALTPLPVHGGSPAGAPVGIHQAIRALQPFAALCDEIEEMAKKAGNTPEGWAKVCWWENLVDARTALTLLEANFSLSREGLVAGGDGSSAAGAAPFDQWQPMSAAPKDGKPILALCDHDADPYVVSENKLTIYGGHCEGLSHVEDGPHVIQWGGGSWESTDEYGSGYLLPDWWFQYGSEYEVAANPIAWMPIPEQAAAVAGGEQDNAASSARCTPTSDGKGGKSC